MVLWQQSRYLANTTKQQTNKPKEIVNKMIKNITALLGVLAAVASLSLADSAPEASAQDLSLIHISEPTRPY